MCVCINLCAWCVCKTFFARVIVLGFVYVCCVCLCVGYVCVFNFVCVW